MNIFKNKTGYRIGWKILFAFLLFVFAEIISLFVAVLIFNLNNLTSITEMISSTMGSSTGNALQSAILIIMLWIAYYILVNKNVVSRVQLGLSDRIPKAISKFGCGFFIGIIFICVEIALLCIFCNTALSEYSKGIDAVISVLCGLVSFAGVAFSEEITFRGFIQGQFCKEREILGITVTTITFAAIHLLNSSYTFYSLIYLLIGGLAFSLMRIVTKGLWFPIGFHMAWDWMEVSVFGLNVKGEKHWLYIESDNLTDSLLCACIMLVVIIVLLFIYRKQKTAKI